MNEVERRAGGDAGSSDVPGVARDFRLMKNYIKTLGEKDKKTIRAIVRLAEFYIHTGKKEDARKAAEYAKRIMNENGVIDNTLMNRINSCIKKST